jgi:enoyl-CoA hydratase
MWRRAVITHSRQLRRQFSGGSELPREFAQAQGALKTLTEDPGNDVKLNLYGLFKQASAGDVHGDSPSMFDMVGKAKYGAWETRKGLSSDDAMLKYIEEVKSLMPGGALPDVVAESTAASAASGGAVSVGAAPAPTLQDIAYPRSSLAGCVVELGETLSTIKVSQADNGVLTVTMNRPNKGNSFNLLMWHEFTQVFDAINRDSDVRCVVLTGGEKTFSTGMDLSVFADMNNMSTKEACPGRMRESLVHVIKFLQNAVSGPERCQVPVIASIAGNCIGGAVDIITACDMRYCTDDSTFCIKETDLAMVADIGTTQRLPKLIGDSQTRELTYTAREFDGREAARLGLALQTFPGHEDMHRHVQSVAASIAAKSPLTIRGAKSTLLYVFCSMLFLLFPVCDLSLSLSRSITAHLHSLVPHDTSLTIIPHSINHQSTQYSHNLLKHYLLTNQVHPGSRCERGARSDHYAQRRTPVQQ